MTVQLKQYTALPRAVTYLRSVAPTRERRIAIDAQRYSCERRANELGAVVVGEYVDTGSGLTYDRVNLQCMLDHLAENDVSYVIATEHTTIAHTMDIYVRIVWKIEQAGARLVIASTPLDEYKAIRPNPLSIMQSVADWATEETSDPDSPAGQMDQQEPST
jgi:DNA invertase Pin-like site-specific DNA recombinase